MNTGKKVHITTRDVTRGAMAAAIYALLLFLNQQTALGVETAIPWLFIFPIYLYAAASPFQASFTCALAMILETFLFGGFTTWFYSWTGILSGFLAGAAIRKGASGQVRLAILFVKDNKERILGVVTVYDIARDLPDHGKAVDTERRGSR